MLIMLNNMVPYNIIQCCNEYGLTMIGNEYGLILVYSNNLRDKNKMRVWLPD